MIKAIYEPPNGRICATLVDSIWLFAMSIPKAKPAHKAPTPRAPA